MSLIFLFVARKDLGDLEPTVELLGLLRIPRSTPVPWIKDNAILALPDNVLTYVVLYTFS
jgi:hypothetical protein